MKSRDETLQKFQHFCADVGQPLTLVSDSAKEYKSNDFKKCARLKGIRLENSAAYTPQENGKIEKLWDVTVGTARCLGDQASLEKKYWTYSLNMAFYLKNLSFMKVFGCVAYPFIEKQFRNKIDRKAKKGILLGHARDSRSFLIGTENDRGELKVHKTRNASLDENNYYFGVNEQANLEHEVNKEMSEIVFLSEIVDQNLLPKNAKEALKNENWRKAMQDEYNSLSENKVWDIVADNGAKLVGSRWHFGVKYGRTGEISRFKARFVAKSYSQVLRKGFHEKYSPTTRLSTIRLIVSLSVQKGPKLIQMDIKTAYLIAPIAEKYYMKQSEGFEQLDNKGKPLICLMKKSLYGLKQSGRNWFQTFRNFLVAKGFESSVHDNCLFIKKIERQLQGAVSLWVDDIISCEFQERFSSWFESELSKDFKISDFRDLCWFLGMKIVKKKRKFF